MITPLRSRIGVAVFTLALSSAALAQSSLQSTPAPTVTAENEPWYLSGGPVAYGGSIYYPAGAAIHFVRDEMVPTGTFGKIPVFVRTTQEPGSVIYVPLAGGVMRPYERRRTGDLAGTTGSSAPSFVVALPSEAAAPTPPAAHPPAGVATVMTTSPVAVADHSAGRVAAASGPRPRPARVDVVVQTAPARTRIQTVQRPVGINAVFIQFQGARWYAAGPAVEFSADRFTRIGEHRGFNVFEERGKPGTIYLSLLNGGAGLIAPYKTPVNRGPWSAVRGPAEPLDAVGEKRHEQLDVAAFTRCSRTAPRTANRTGSQDKDTSHLCPGFGGLL